MPRARSSYVRDSNGRFASTPGGPASKKRTPKPKATGGTLAARAQLRASKAKLTPAATRQQKGAVTRASNKLVKTKADNKKKLSVLSATQNTIRKGGEMARVIAFGKKKAAMQNAAAKKKQAVQERPVNNAQNKKPIKKMGKAPANKAKNNYKAAKSFARELKMQRAGKTDAYVKKAEAKVKKMEKNRKASKYKVNK